MDVDKGIECTMKVRRYIDTDEYSAKMAIGREKEYDFQRRMKTQRRIHGA